MDNKNKTADELEALSPEEIKAIGEIEIGPSKQDQFLNKHYKKLIAGGAVLIVVICTGICLATFHQQHKDAGAAALVGAVSTAETDAATPAEYSAKDLSLVQEQYAGTESATTARMMEGLSLLSVESTAEKGVAILNEVADSAEDPFLVARALSAIASHYTGCIAEARPETVKRALDAWKRVTALPVNTYTAYACLTLGDLSKGAGDTEAARSYYNQLLKTCPKSALVGNRVVQDRLELLDTDEPVEVEPLPALPTTPTGQPSSLTPGSTPDIFGGLQFPSTTPTPATPATPGVSTESPLLPGLSTPLPAPADVTPAPAAETPAPAEATPAPAEETPAPAEAN